MNWIFKKLQKWYQNLQYELWGYCEIDGKWYVNCKTHGFSLGYKCGYQSHIICTECMKQLTKDSYEYHLTQIP